MNKVIESTVINVTDITGEVTEFTLEAPNGDVPFEFDFREIPLRANYRDKNNVLQKGVFKYEVFWRYRYESHEMDLRTLLAATKITLKAPPNYFGDYQEFEVMLTNEQAIKNYLSGLPVADEEGDKMPSGDVVCEFQLMQPLTWEEMLALKWYQDEIQLQPDPPANLTADVLEDNIHSLSFDGVNDFAALSTPLNILNDRTISLWIYVESGGANQIILGNRGDSPARGYRMRLNSDNRLFCFHTGVANANITSEDPIPLQEWVHVAWVTEGAEGAKLYVNFEESASIETSDDAITSDQNFKFGEVYGGSGYFHGKMDEIQIWDIPLGLAAIQAAAEQPLEGDEAGLAGYWRMEEGSGAVAIDATGNNNADITGASYSSDVPFSNKKIALDWDEVVDVDGYNVYVKSSTDAEYTKVNGSIIEGTDYEVLGLESDIYEIYVTASRNEVESEPSNIVEVYLDVFYTDFSEYATNAKPSDWTYRWNTSQTFANLWRVQEDAGATGGKVLRYPTQATNANRLITWDILDGSKNVELEMRVKGYTLTTGNNRSRQWLLARGGGTESTRDGYVTGFLMDSGGSTRETYKFVNNVTTSLSSASVTIGVEEWWLVKLRIVESSLQIKIWKEGDAEPAFTDISDSDVSAEGWAGIAANLRGQVDIDWFKCTLL